jgi:hypothetical protein
MVTASFLICELYVVPAIRGVKINVSASFLICELYVVPAIRGVKINVSYRKRCNGFVLRKVLLVYIWFIPKTVIKIRQLWIFISSHKFRTEHNLCIYMHSLTPANNNTYFLLYSLFITDVSQSFRLAANIFSGDIAMTLPLTFDSTDTNFGHQ